MDMFDYILSSRNNKMIIYDEKDFYYRYNKIETIININFLLNKKIKNVLFEKDMGDIIEILFELEGNQILCMYHEQQCCESVSVEDIVGDIKNLIGNTIVMAEETSNQEDDEYIDGYTQTWTFYKLADDKGNYVTIRWYGSSNGYYSESVDLALVEYRN